MTEQKQSRPSIFSLNLKMSKNTKDKYLEPILAKEKKFKELKISPSHSVSGYFLFGTRSKRAQRCHRFAKKCPTLSNFTQFFTYAILRWNTVEFTNLIKFHREKFFLPKCPHLILSLRAKKSQCHGVNASHDS